MSLRHALLAGSVSAMALIAGQAFAQDAQAPVSTVDEVVQVVPGRNEVGPTAETLDS